MAHLVFSRRISQLATMLPVYLIFAATFCTVTSAASISSADGKKLVTHWLYNHSFLGSPL